MRNYLLFICTLLASLPLAVPRAWAEDEILIKYFDIADGRLAFTYQKESKRTILVLDLAALEATPLLDLKGANEAPRFSPDGQKIIYVSDRSGKKELYVAHADGSDPVRVSASGTEETEPDWSPDGKKIVFAGNHGAAGSEIYIANADGSGAQEITNTKKKNIAPRWSPDGHDIVFVTNEYWPGTDLLSYNLGTKKITILTTGYASAAQPSFSRDGSQFTYVSGPNDDLDIILYAKGKKPEAMIARAGRDIAPEWFDNGTKLWFLGEPEPGSGHLEIFLRKVETKEDIQLTECSGNILDLSWTPTSAKSKKAKGSSSSEASSAPSSALSSESSSSAASEAAPVSSSESSETTPKP